MVRHPSGRPWVIGRWHDEELTSASAGSNAVVLLGRARISESELARKLAAMRSVSDVDSLSRSSHGCFHLLASIGGQVRAQGSLTTVRQVFYGSVAGVAVAADRPQSVAALTEAGIDEELVALRLLFPTAPHPLSQACLWRGVTSLPLGHYLLMPANSGARPVRWWTPPEPSVPLAQGADTLRRALEAAVETRTAHSATVSTDLSGGMDSTSLCFLAAPRAARLVTYHHVPLGPSNARWLRSSAALLGPEPGKRGTGPAWESPPAMPLWATPRAVSAVRSLIHAAADGEPDPLAPLPVQHDMLSVAQLCGEMTRRASRFTARHGLSYEAPYLDDRVVETAM
ncbi:asparagine synthase-related protein [Streptomyces sp. WAC 01529]|uniref:asparagine synthase-related protein n=1 Tax=Streptomyces sp. WAC 01529 TaxID=2203205 RepID=UPI000F745707|nr:asparagine synthase-related protein [Streptomyces sp. WAC 01529]